LQQDAARQLQSGGHVERVVQVRIVDQPFPAHRRARLLEVDPHDHEHPILDAAGQIGQPLGILQSRLFVVNRTGADDGDEPLIFAGQNAFNRRP
jgi:hypothetical protein